MYVELVFPLPFRKAFTYSVPGDLGPLVKTGVRAVAPFGKRTLTGFIINISKTTSVTEKIKPIKDVLDVTPIFDKKGLKFYQWVADYYLSSLGEALKLAVPQGSDIESKRKIIADTKTCKFFLSKEKKRNSTKFKVLKELSEIEEIYLSSLQKRVGKKNIYSILQTLQKQGAITLLDSVGPAKVKVKKVKFAKLDKSVAEIYARFPELERRSPKQVKLLLELVAAKRKPLPVAELLHKTESSKSSLDSLSVKGFITIFDKEVERKFTDHYKEDKKEIILYKQQQNVVDEINKEIEQSRFKTFLLHGVTGSGKTQVYIELIKTVLEKKKTALILVPEISLTPQMTSRLFNNFGETVTVIHSRMSAGERYDSWRKVLKGRSKVVIGARSALFSPLRKIGLIVVDEEHDASYKQSDQTPRYLARDAAIILGSIQKCPVVLGSATPSIESMYNARTGKYKLLELPERIDDAKLPKILMVNLKKKKKKE